MAGNLSQSIHVPNMVPINMHFALCCQQMEGSQLQVIQRTDWPTILPVRRHIFFETFSTILEPVLKTPKQQPDIHRSFAGLLSLMLKQRPARKLGLPIQLQHTVIAEVPALRRPRHQFTIQAGPTVLNSSQKPAEVSADRNAVEELRFEVRIVEESSTCSGVNNSRFAADDAKAVPGPRRILADDNDGP